MTVDARNGQWNNTNGYKPRRAFPPADPKRERTIARLAVLKAAANFAATRSDIKSADVLAIATRWLTWVDAP